MDAVVNENDDVTSKKNVWKIDIFILWGPKRVLSYVSI